MPTKLDYSQRYGPKKDTGGDGDDEDGDDTNNDDYDRPIWGYLVTDDSNTTIDWPKLLLLDDVDLPTHLQNSAWLNKSRKKVRALRKRPSEVIADHIRQLWRYVFGDEITRGYIDRHLLPPLTAFRIKTRVVVTIPAIWKNKALQAMRNALGASILGNETSPSSL